MGETSAISWTDATFSPWWGCVEVSPACDHCYARTFAHRLGKEIWGKDAPRRFFGDKHWNEPVRWNRRAAKEGRRLRVFCSSMADVFEDRADLVEPRKRLFARIEDTFHLDWLLLTKRPGNIERFGGRIIGLKNVWLGTTVEDRARLPRIEQLRAVPHGGVKFLSIEPLLEDLGAVDLTGINWVIVGGESGHGSRPFDLAWARKLRDQAHAAGARYFLKQLGANVVVQTGALRERLVVKGKGDNPALWPSDLRIQEFPAP